MVPVRGLVPVPVLVLVLVPTLDYEVVSFNAPRVACSGMTHEGSLISVRRRVVLVAVKGSAGDRRSRFTGDPLRP